MKNCHYSIMQTSGNGLLRKVNCARANMRQHCAVLSKLCMIWRYKSKRGGNCTMTVVFFGVIYQPLLLIFDDKQKSSKVRITEYVNQRSSDLKVVHFVYLRLPIHMLTSALPLQSYIPLADGYILAFSVALTEEWLMNILLQLSFMCFLETNTWQWCHTGVDHLFLNQMHF